MQTAASMELFKKYKVLPPLVSMRNATGKFDFGSRKQSWELYYLSHVFPSSVWCILMMLQNIDSIRRKSPRLHRYLGRIALAISSLLTLSGFSLLRLGIAYRTRDWFHIHTLKYRDYPVLFWPSFTSLTDSVGILMVLTGYKLLVHAWKGDDVRHRTWAKLHTYTGFTIPLQRVWLGVMPSAELSANALATLLSALTTLWLIYRDFYGTPNRPKPAFVKVE
ncbi:uncharacterized protein UTRI_10668 [Ustilago trichophora]|uniref:Uncharacterized protein n=1 Tax=Ustilago trichophora TaxID=86804 RepID=A0A5C3E9M7_9BASI|nr:uncharacterized protein UTRI_10668 [Ustilago trichophora]